MIVDVRTKEIDTYRRINELCRSGMLNPRRDCCKSLRNTLIRLMVTSKEGTKPASLDEFDDDGAIKDDGKWDYKRSLGEIASKIKHHEVAPIFNFNKEIHDFI